MHVVHWVGRKQGGHYDVRLFIGRYTFDWTEVGLVTSGNLGLAGTITVRDDEWKALSDHWNPKIDEHLRAATSIGSLNQIPLMVVVSDSESGQTAPAGAILCQKWTDIHGRR